MGGFAPSAIFVLLAATLIDFATDTPVVDDRYLGPFLRLTPASARRRRRRARRCCSSCPSRRCSRRAGSAMAPPSRAFSARIVRLLPLPPMLVTLHWTRELVAPDARLGWNVMCALAVLLVGLAAALRWPRWLIAVVVATVGNCVRLVHFAHFPIDGGADMLPLVRSALGAFCAGKSPYAYYDLPDPLPLTYYPLTWIAYLPTYAAHLDLRWTNLVAEMAILAAIFVAGRTRSEAPPPNDAGGLAPLAWSFYFLLPSSIYFDRITTAPIAWAMIAWCIALCSRDARKGWVAFALTGATTPLALVIAPLVITMWWRKHALRGAVVRVAKSALVAALIIVPFVLWSPRGFLDGAVLWFNDLHRYPGTTWKAYEPWKRYVGFGGIFWSDGLERVLAPIQWALVGAVTLLYLRRRAPPELLAPHVAAAFVAFMAFNSVHWPYFYQPAIFCGLVAIAVTNSEPAARARSVWRSIPA